MATVLTVHDFFAERRIALKLSLIAGKSGLRKHKIEVPDIYRPGLVLSGYFEYFPPERVQVFGRTEIEYLKELKPARVKEILKKFFSHPLVCLVVTQTLSKAHPLVQWSAKKDVPLLHSGLPTTRLMAELTTFFEDKLAPHLGLHGTLVEVYGLGVLLLGKSGIGKSECALELVKRGHRLITDDLVKVRRPKENYLVGWGDDLIQHHMEIRGMGIIDVRDLFGVGAVRSDCQVQLAIQIEKQDAEKEYDRTGLVMKTYSLLSVVLPYIELPVQPGRSLAIIIEVAAMQQRLRNSGVNTAERLNERIGRAMEARRIKSGSRNSLQPKAAKKKKN